MESVQETSPPHRWAEKSQEEQQIEVVKHGGGGGSPGASDVESADSEEKDTIFWDASTWINVAALVTAYISSTYAATVPTGAIAYIIANWPAEAGSAPWIATALTLVVTVIVLPLGEFIDIFGRKRPFILSCVAGLVGSIITSRATSLQMVIVGQVFNGVGLAAGYLIQPVLYEIVPKRHRPLTGAITGIFCGGAYILAPIVEGIVIKKEIGGPLEGWRAGIYVSAGLYGLGMIALLVGYSPSPRTLGVNLSTRQRLKKMDWIAILLLMAGLTMFFVGMGIGDVLYPWKSAAPICLLVIGFVLILGAAFKTYKNKDGLLPHSLFTHRNFALSLVVRATGSFAQLGCQAYLPQVIVYLFESDGLLQAVWTLPFSVANIGGALVTAGVFWYTKEGRWLAVVAMGTLAIGAGTMTLVKPTWSFVQFMWPPLIIGLSVGTEAQVLNIIAALATPDEYVATTVAATTLFACAGSTIGITIFGQIFNSKKKKYLPLYVAEAVLAAGLPQTSLERFLTAMATASDASAYADIPGVTPAVLSALQVSTKDAYAKSFTYIWYALLAFALVTMAIACFFKTTKPQMTAKVSSPVQETVIAKMAHHVHHGKRGDDGHGHEYPHEGEGGT
ncbi:hypothetical protein AYO21_10626 [Fonsecaea monophora]|uniref:Major facilitator superfamily (MFS) profile domain-containing protein n=1 Tax=Fonsecaea monophora TaxID=254056 RepID=A0A177ETF5_9EURO|nr:hypothetical protein AYO21_10626 [Fonsecaea monophora]KAH0829721.1 hypothetical protein FOPE_10293 [Fonsecaea pedrosoi]OAG35228.1 hypothetical protein AYO21_10626 [Fonsecaea monophora]